jgi:hypothetical protein
MSVSTDDNLPKKMEWLQRDWYDLCLGVVSRGRRQGRKPELQMLFGFPRRNIGGEPVRNLEEDPNVPIREAS